LQASVTGILDRHALDYDIKWNLSGMPFLTPAGRLVEASQQAIKEIAGYETELSTAGGTSDGRFIAPTGAQVLELGPINATIHQVDECVSVKDNFSGILSLYITKWASQNLVIFSNSVVPILESMQTAQAFKYHRANKSAKNLALFP